MALWEEIMGSGALQPWHIVILAIVAMVVFGSKRLPDAARSLGRSMRIFKSELKEMQNDDAASTALPTSAQQSQPALPAQNPAQSTTIADQPHTADPTAPSAQQ